MFIYHFVDLDLGELRYSSKRRVTKLGPLILKKGLRHLCKLVLEVEDNFMRDYQPFNCFFSYKERIALKAIFHIDLPGYASEPRQRYKIRLLLVYLELGVREGGGGMEH